MASSSPAAGHGEGAATSAGAAVCCMCGDRGLADELFRCRCCRARLQHRYCSDLYPRAAAYRQCNWCLRAPPPEPDQGVVGRAAAAAAANYKPEEKRKTTVSDEAERPRHHEACSPRRPSPPAELGHPVKKKHRAEERTPQPGAVAGRKEVVSTAGAANGSTKDEEVKVMRAPAVKTRVNRARVPRYKLLTEVIISC